MTIIFDYLELMSLGGFFMYRTTLDQWRMLNALIEHGGFAQAANAVNKSQSTVHHAVHKLEDMLGIKLIEVKGRKAYLTKNGEVLLKRGRYLLEELYKVETMALTLKNGIETHLKIAVDEAFPQNLLHAALEQVSRKYPQIRIELYETVLSGANEMLLSNQIKISISPYSLKNCVSQELSRIEFVAVASPDHKLLSGKSQITFEMLKLHRQIVVRDSAVKEAKSEGWLGSDQRWTVSNIQTSIDLVTQGLGYAWLPEPSIRNLLETNKLLPLNLKVGRKRSVNFYLNILDWDNLGIAASLFCEKILPGQKN